MFTCLSFNPLFIARFCLAILCLCVRVFQPNVQFDKSVIPWPHLGLTPPRSQHILTLIFNLFDTMLISNAVYYTARTALSASLSHPMSCLSVGLLAVYMSVCLPLFLNKCLSDYQLVCMYVCLPLFLNKCLSDYQLFYMSVCLPLYLNKCLSDYRLVCMSVCLPLFLS